MALVHERGGKLDALLVAEAELLHLVLASRGDTQPGQASSSGFRSEWRNQVTAPSWKQPSSGLRRRSATHGRLYQLAVPAAAFFSMMGMLGESGLAKGARVIIEKPFGTDLASARAQPSRLAACVCLTAPAAWPLLEEPLSGPPVRHRYFRGQRPAQIKPQEIRQQVVVAEPPAPGAQRFDERVSVLEAQQDRFRARPIGRQAGRLVIDPVEHRGEPEQILDVRSLALVKVAYGVRASTIRRIKGLKIPPSPGRRTATT